MASSAWVPCSTRARRPWPKPRRRCAPRSADAHAVLGRQRDLDRVRDGLTSWLSRRMPGARDLRLSALRAPKAGVSNETLLFDAEYHDGTTARPDPPLPPPHPPHPPALPAPPPHPP